MFLNPNKFLILSQLFFSGGLSNIISGYQLKMKFVVWSVRSNVVLIFPWLQVSLDLWPGPPEHITRWLGPILGTCQFNDFYSYSVCCLVSTTDGAAIGFRTKVINFCLFTFNDDFIRQIRSLMYNFFFLFSSLCSIIFSLYGIHVVYF